MSGMFEQGLARRGQLHAAGAADKQFHAHLVLQVADLAAQRWLRREKPLLRRHGQAARFGHGHEIPQMPQFHAANLRHESRYGFSVCLAMTTCWI